MLFARVPVLGVAWLRIASAAVLFGVWRRPWRALREPLVLAWGATLAVMNCCFYEAISRLALGTVAAIEFVPVVGLAALGVRSRRNVVALALAVGGVALLSDLQLSGRPVAFAFAAANAALFAIYIVLAHRASSRDGVGALAGAMVVAAVVVTPLGGLAVVRTLTDPVALMAGVGVGVCSSVVPYVADQLAMARLPRATYALMFALLPAMAVLIGVVVLGQLPSATEMLAVALVIAGVAIHRQAATASGSTAGAASGSGCGSGDGAVASATTCAPTAPITPASSASAAHLGPENRSPSTDSGPGPTSASVSAAAIRTTLYS